MEQRNLKIQFAKSGNGYSTTRITLPINWIKEMGINPDEREVKVTFKDSKIIIEKA